MSHNSIVQSTMRLRNVLPLMVCAFLASCCSTEAKRLSKEELEALIKKAETETLSHSELDSIIKYDHSSEDELIRTRACVFESLVNRFYGEKYDQAVLQLILIDILRYYTKHNEHDLAENIMLIYLNKGLEAGDDEMQWSYTQLGQIRERKGDMPGAIDFYQEAGDCVRAHLGLARIAETSGDWQRSMDYYTRALNREREWVKAYLDEHPRGNVNRATERIQEAEAGIERVKRKLSAR